MVTKSSHLILLGLSALSSTAALVWSGFPLVNTLLHYSSVNGWISLGLLVIVGPPALAVAIFGGWLPMKFIPAGVISPRACLRFKLLSWIAMASAVASFILGLTLSGRGGC